MRRFVAAVALVVVSSGLVPGQPAPKKVALLVGVNHYTKRGQVDLPALEYAERDVTELAELLAKQGFATKVLTGSHSLPHLVATKTNVDAALRTSLKDRNKDDIILVALAGHGCQFVPDGGKTEEAFFCPQDAVVTDPKSMVNLRELVELLDKKGGQNLLLVDACRNDPSPNRSGGVVDLPIEKIPQNTAILFSCAKGERAYESKDAGGGHGLLFHFVLEGLRGKAANDDGEIDWDGLKGYVVGKLKPEVVKAWVHEAAKPQHPHGASNFVGRTPVLARVKGAGSVTEKPDDKKVPPKGAKATPDGTWNLERSDKRELTIEFFRDAKNKIHCQYKVGDGAYAPFQTASFDAKTRTVTFASKSGGFGASTVYIGKLVGDTIEGTYTHNDTFNTPTTGKFTATRMTE